MPRGRPRKTTDAVLFKSAEMIGWALGGIEREIVATRARLSALTSQANRLRSRMGTRRGRPPVAAATFDEPLAKAPAQRRREMSAEARKRISEMMKKRWAERRRQGKKRL
jgi:hypothetical protein